MKKAVILLCIFFSILSCKEDKKEDTKTFEDIVKESKASNDGLTLIEGEFIYFSDAAVLQTRTSIFGVVLNETTKQLIEQAKPHKKAATDAVKVKVKGLIEPKAEGKEGWDYNVNIKKIISVEAVTPKENEIIKIEK